MIGSSDRHGTRAAPAAVLAFAVLALAGGGPGAAATPDGAAPLTDAAATPRVGPDTARQERPARPIPPLRIPSRRPVFTPPDARAADTLPPILDLSLSEAAPADVAPPSPSAPSPLPAARVEALLARLPGQAPGSDAAPDRAAPAPPDASPGPAPTQAPTSAGGALEVIAVLPRGETSLATDVTVAFSRPMVALGRDGEPLDTEAPVALEPRPPGRWRWLDVRTLRYEPEAGRLPGGTTFTVRVPAATTALGGDRLAEPVEERFHTTGPLVLGGHPNALGGPGGGLSAPRSPLLLVFDQRVDAGAVLDAARLEADGRTWPLELSAIAALEAEDPELAEVARTAGEAFHVVLRPRDPLPAGSEAVLRLDAQLASLEGPHPTGRVQELRFRVRGPLRVQHNECGSAAAPCTADGTWRVTFTNPLAPDQPLAERVRIEPAVRDVRIVGRGTDLFVVGDLRPHTEYRLVLDPELRDRFGQRLGPVDSVPGHVGAPLSFVLLPGAPLVTLDPASEGRLRLDVRAVPEVRLEAWAVGPEQWPAFHQSLDVRHNPGGETWRPPGEPLARWTRRPADGGTGFAVLSLDLSDVLRRAGGPVLVIASAEGIDEPRAHPRFPRSAAAWVQAPSFAVGAAWSPGELVAWTTSLSDRRPLEGVRVGLSGSDATVRTGPDGLARISLPSTPDSVLVARWRDQVAILPTSAGSRWNDGWKGDAAYPHPVWFTVTDRGLYRAGEAMVVQGWIRELAGSPRRDLVLPERVDSVRWRVRSQRREVIAEGSARVGSTGTFHFTVELPADVRSGYGRVELEAVASDLPAGSWSESAMFRIEAFRTPEYEVSVEVDPGPYLPGDVVEATVTSTYYGGEGLPGAPVSWRVSAEEGRWAPPGWLGWSFGAAFGPGQTAPARADLEGRTGADGRHAVRLTGSVPRVPFPVHVGFEAEVRDVDRRAGSSDGAVVLHPARLTAGIHLDRYWLRAGDEVAFDVAVTDLDGRPAPSTEPVFRAALEPDPRRPGGGRAQPVTASCSSGDPTAVGEWTVRPLRCAIVPPTHGVLVVEAEVVDEEGRRSLTRRRVPVYGRSGAFAGPGRGDRLDLALDRRAYEPGDTALLAISAPTYPLTGLMTITRFGIREVRPIRLEAPGHVERIPVHDEDAGALSIHVNLHGANPALSSVQAWEPLSVDPAARRLQVEVPALPGTVQPGDSVDLEVRVRDAAGDPVREGDVSLWLVDEAVLSLGGYGLPDPLGVLLRRTDWPSVVLPHETVAWDRAPVGPGVLTAELLDGATGAPLSGLTARLEGTDVEAPVSDGVLLLRDVPPGRHRLVLASDGEVVAEQPIDVAPGGTDLGTVLLGSPARDPQTLELRGMALNELSVVGLPFTARGEMEPAMRRAREVGMPAPPMAEVRRRFVALAAFEHDVPLDADGRARVRVGLPDNITRYRILAVATSGATRFGAGEGAVTASRELVLRASFPTALRTGDRAELPVVVQNASESALDVEVAARTSGPRLDGPAGFRIRLPAGARSEVRFPVTAGAVGSGRFEVIAAAVGGDHVPATDAVELPLQVRPPLAPRASAVHQTVRAGDALRLRLETPARAYAGWGGLDVGLSTTRLLPLVEVVRSLCLDPLFLPEATVARVLGLAGLGDALDALRSPDLPAPDALRALVRSDVRRLEAWATSSSRQRDDLSAIDAAHLAHALHVASRAGFDVQEWVLSRASNATEARWRAERDGLAALGRPASGWEVVPAVYALHVAFRTGAIDVRPGSDEATWMSALEPADLPVEALAWLLAPAAAHPDSAALTVELLRELENRALTTAATVTFRQGSRSAAGDDDPLRRLVLASDRRADAVVLTALVEARPDHRLVPGLVRGLLGHRDGSWAGSAHENGWVLLALGRYASLAEAGTGAERVTASVDVGNRPLLPATALGPERPSVAVSAPLPAPGSGADLQVTSSREEGAVLYVRAGVRYAPVLDPDAPPEDRGFLISRRYEAVDDSADVRRGPDGTWRVRAGARVRVRLTLTAPGRRYRVQLSDPLPAGLEAINPTLRGVGFADDPEPAASPEGPFAAVGAPLGATLSNVPYGWEWTDLLFRWRAAFQGWASHVEVRADRLESYAPYLPAGTYESTYLARAVTPGRFIAPPARIEESAEPETYGAGTADRMVVVGR